MTAFIKRLFKDRRAATAVAMAILAVPLIISASAAVDFARIASARALLQASADAAAIAGAGAWQTSESSSSASSVAAAAYAGTAAQLSNFITTTAQAPLLTCTGSTAQCGGSASFVTSPSTYSCPSSAEYCVVVQATGVLKNSLFAWLIPSETLSVRSVATTAFPAATISSSNFSSTSVGSAWDLSGISAYIVPKTSSGATDYANVPKANTNCTSSNSGAIGYETNKATPDTGVTGCNYVLIGTSTGSSASGSLTFSSTDSIAFSFANMTGETTSYSLDKTYRYATNITYSTSKITYSSAGVPTTGTFAASGHTVVSGSTQPCTGNWWNQKCTTTYSSLYGECPQHNLYGAFSQKLRDSNQITNGATSDDSLNIYSSAYEVLGYTPTHGTNHTLPSFQSQITETFNGTTYYVSVQCPQWPITHAQEVADTSDQGITNPGYVPADTNITAGTASTVTTGMVAPSTNAYSTYYPDTINTDTSGDIYPPVVSGCKAASYPNSSSNTSSSSTAEWWGWTGSNIAGNNCTNEPSSDTGYNNCALIIQPLGSSVPKDSSGGALLPDYYNVIKDSSGNLIAYDPVWDNATYTDVLTGVSVTTSTTSGWLPTSASHATITSSTTVHGSSTAVYKGSKYIGDILYTVVPYNSSDKSLPADTASRCYNPRANGSAANFVTNDSGTYSTSGNNNNGTAIDPIANPQDGAIMCGTSAYIGKSFGIYWNDEGGQMGDPIGYMNAATVFTCPSPTTTSSGGGPATLSG